MNYKLLFESSQDENKKLIAKVMVLKETIRGMRKFQGKDPQGQWYVTYLEDAKMRLERQIAALQENFDLLALAHRSGKHTNAELLRTLADKTGTDPGPQTPLVVQSTPEG